METNCLKKKKFALAIRREKTNDPHYPHVYHTSHMN